MDVRQAGSITGVGSPASARVASSLVPKGAATGTAKPLAAATAGTAASSSNITASDFLTLLVSELKNQDPTQPTDPNAYITQLVGVNSLQQLIQINSGLTTLETPASVSPPPASGAATSAVAGAGIDPVAGAPSIAGQRSTGGGAAAS